MVSKYVQRLKYIVKSLRMFPRFLLYSHCTFFRSYSIYERLLYIIVQVILCVDLNHPKMLCLPPPKDIYIYPLEHVNASLFGKKGLCNVIKDVEIRRLP